MRMEFITIKSKKIIDLLAELEVNPISIDTDGNEMIAEYLESDIKRLLNKIKKEN